MTGRAAGYCAGYPVPGFMNRGPGGYFGWGRGRGGGRGQRNWFYATGLTGQQRAAMGWPAFGDAPPYAAPYAPPYAAPYAAPYGAPFEPAMSREQELDALKDQAEGFEEALKEIKNRIKELESQAAEKTD